MVVKVIENLSETWFLIIGPTKLTERTKEKKTHRIFALEDKLTLLPFYFTIVIWDQRWKWYIDTKVNNKINKFDYSDDDPAVEELTDVETLLAGLQNSILLFVYKLFINYTHFKDGYNEFLSRFFLIL